MQTPSDLPEVVSRLAAVFEPRCNDVTTLSELKSMAGDPALWKGAHDLFQRIRQKALRVERQNDKPAAAQYCFEEVCAKTLYNLSGSPAPFDADSPEWIVPNALALAKVLAVPEVAVRAAIAGRGAGA